ncbi:MAG TPA: 2-oxo acid dehydrogenase subunit E2 [Candidatus Krumholzibacteria bacterium]|nr:2-oxo acid dehydrogenase subunit E2 [Candidatus Krumholzibacteria bacterium]
MKQEIRVPEVSDGVTKGKVIGLSVAVGDRVEVDQALLEMETDKAVVAVPSPFTGKITAILVDEGDEVAVGQVVMAGEPEDGAGASPEPEAKPESQPEPEPATQASTPAAAAPEPPRPAPAPAASGSLPPPRTEPTPPAEVAPASPVVRRFARELGVDIHAVRGSGPGGRISEQDVRDFVKAALAGGGGGGAVAVSRPLPDFAKWGEIAREPLSQVRKITADAMAYAWATAPRVTQDDKADITALEAFRKQYNRKAPDDAKLTMTAILVKVVAEALHRFPQLNSTLDLAAGELILKRYVHVGVAVDTPGGLLVPVIRDADRKGVATLAAELNATAAKTRERRISPADMEGGCFTISNLGGIGGTGFTPIVYAPQVAILGVSRAEMEPVWDGEGFEPRLRMPLSLSYDHRVVDGADGARFLRWICEALEQPLLLAMEDAR